MFASWILWASLHSVTLISRIKHHSIILLAVICSLVGSLSRLLHPRAWAEQSGILGSCLFKCVNTVWSCTSGRTPHCFFTSTAATAALPQSVSGIPGHLPGPAEWAFCTTLGILSWPKPILGHLSLGQKPWLLQLRECSSPSFLLSQDGSWQGHPNLLHSSISYIYEKPATIVHPSPPYGEAYSVISWFFTQITAIPLEGGNCFDFLLNNYLSKTQRRKLYSLY